jgi:NAD(P)H-hydrate repair Nnr-like enzyme with NAD(P)H-hydrate dehydratase domain
LQKDPILAAKNASVMAKRIGDALKKKHKGYTYLASDMVEEIRRLC